MLHAALPGAADRKMTHPERGTMTFQTVVETMAGHDLNHLAQLRRLEGRAAKGLPQATSDGGAGLSMVTTAVPELLQPEAPSAK